MWKWLHRLLPKRCMWCKRLMRPRVEVVCGKECLDELMETVPKTEVCVGCGMPSHSNVCSEACWHVANEEKA